MARSSMRTGVRRVLAGGVAGLLLAGGALVAVGTSTAGATSFDTDCSNKSPCPFPVPAGVCQVTIAAWGGSGADDTVGSGSTGGAGGRIRALFTVSGNQVLQVVVGQEGGSGFNSGGQGAGAGGQGGGSSAVTLGSTVLIVAGGGGGGGELAGGGNGGVATTTGPSDPGTGQNGHAGSVPSDFGAGGSAGGAPGDGTMAVSGADAGGGGAGAAPGSGDTDNAGGATGGGGGGGNFTTSTAGLADPGSPVGRSGQVNITAGAPGVGCPPPAAVVVAPRFTG